ncbi:E3 ubiquitin/ISG15 ligase TRIM25-like isoform X1 [Eleutherodactylus coqui]|uniref:E3 ubiquitin/ISG15 ligase TRIM25-like isoform X1 n=1 Tax=Eleutherodactylus coqui TaxID=57060 RepID=UPI0034627F22
MASANLRTELECSICLHLYTDPVTLRCGHNFCRVCIDQVLNTQNGSGVYSCPECREEFPKRPVLKRNITLCNVVENFPSAQLHQEEITEIFCTYCIHAPVLAVKSCLHCEASLCDNHLRVHSKSAEHVLTEPRTSMESRKCSVHKKILEYYCTEDAACICVSCCLIGQHQGHKMESLDEASEKKMKKLRNVLQKLTTKREKTEEKVRSLEERSKTTQEKSSKEVERVTALFIDIRRRLDDLEKRVLSEISRREEQVSLSLSDMIQKLEVKKDELSRKMRHIEELCNMTDPLTVLQEPDTGDLCDPEEEGGDQDMGGHEVMGEHDGGHDATWGHDGGDWGVELISHLSHTLSDLIRYVTFYVQGPADILLDVNTTANKILISDDLKTATWTDIKQNRPGTSERFQYYQVMSSRGFSSGRHYWDVEISRSRVWRVGMCYPSIGRRGRLSLIGDNKKSWGLYGGRGNNNQYSVRHDSEVIQLPYQISSDRFRICLDYEAGRLSFYQLCDPIRHLHTFTASFTEPLHAILYVREGNIKISGGAAAARSHHHAGNLPRN